MINGKSGDLSNDELHLSGKSPNTLIVKDLRTTKPRKTRKSDREIQLESDINLLIVMLTSEKNKSEKLYHIHVDRERFFQANECRTKVVLLEEYLEDLQVVLTGVQYDLVDDTST